MGGLSLPPLVQVASLCMMAVMPMQLWYAQEGRMYALLLFLVLLSLLFALEGEWIGLAASAAAMLYTQNYAAFYLVVIGFIAIPDNRRPGGQHPAYYSPH